VEDAGAGGHTLNLAVERAGRMDHVDGPADLRCPRDLVVWWHAVTGTEPGRGTDPWRKAERDALAASGIPLLDPATRLAAGAAHFRNALLSARKRLVLAVPSWSHGERHEPHAVWDEIVARLSAEPPDVARVTLDARDLLEGRARVPGLDAVLPTAELTPLALPEARPTWKLDGAHLGPASRHSASSLGSLVGCPLQWVLRYRGGLRAGRAASIPGGPLLNGQLGHRLVEELHRAGVLADPARVRAEAAPLLRTLILEEAAVLLAPGKVFELVQLERQLLEAAQALSELLLASGLSVMDAETSTVVAWRSRELDGRLDLLLRDRDGRDVVLDLKWGGKTYSELLKSGLATQLAVYAAVRQLSTGATALPVAAYFSLASGRVLTTEVGPFAGTRATEGPRMSETWANLQRTVQFVEDSLQRGEVPVTGIGRSLPLLESIGVAEAERGGHVPIPAEGACKYCEHGSLCGKSWEAFQ
jgi:RecB family exonuclease